MPLAWIHNLPKEEAEKLAMELGVPVQGTMDELRKRLKDKWRIVETYLPPQSKDKSEVAVHSRE
jgi:predicted transcriptional regulator